MSDEYINKCIAADIINILPRKRGKWECGKTIPTKIWFCSACNGLVEMAYYCYKGYYKYCPNCGAKMEMEET